MRGRGADRWPHLHPDYKVRNVLLLFHSFFCSFSYFRFSELILYQLNNCPSELTCLGLCDFLFSYEWLVLLTNLIVSMVSKYRRFHKDSTLGFLDLGKVCGCSGLRVQVTYRPGLGTS